MEGPLMYNEVEQIYNDEVLNTRRELQESSVNLEQLAKYCEQSFQTHQDQQAVFDQSKGYVVQSLVNVSHRLTKLSTNLFQLLNTHNQRLDNIGHQLFCIEQNFENVQNLQSKDRLKCLGTTIAIQRQHKVVQNKTISKDSKKHTRTPINMAALDDIGHGVVVPDEPRPVPLQQSIGFMSSRSETLMSRNNDVTPNLPTSRSNIFNPSSVQPNGLHTRPDHAMGLQNGCMPPHNMTLDRGMPPHNMTLDRGMAGMYLEGSRFDRATAIDRSIDRAMTIDRSMMLERDGRQEMYDNMADRQYLPPGTMPGDRLSGTGSDRGSDQLSPSVNNNTRFNNWLNSEESLRSDPGRMMRPVYERSYSSHGTQGPTHDTRQDTRHLPAPYDRSLSSDDFRVQNTAYHRELSQNTPPPPAPYATRTPPPSQYATQTPSQYATQTPYTQPGYPSMQSGPGYPNNIPPGPGYPNNIPPGPGYPNNIPPGPGYPNNIPPGPGYPNNIPPGTGYPSIPPGYPGTLPPHQITTALQYHATKGYGSRGSLDDSSCSSSSPSLHSYKTNSSNQRNTYQHDYDEKSSQPSTNGPLSDSGLGTWAHSDQHIPSDIPPSHGPPSDVELFDPEYNQGSSDYIPSNYVKKVQAIFRYNKTSEDELTLPVGATIYVLQEHSDGWSEGFYNGQCGYFPANFTTIIDR